MISSDEHKLFPAEVVKLDEIAADIFVLSYKKQHDFIAGQVVAITVDLEDEPRLYSIASGEKEREVRILFNVVPEGKLTTQLANLKCGQTIHVSKPFGNFIGSTDAAFWIAVGTGIAPFASMFYSGLGSHKVLVHGGRTLNSFYFKNDFSKHLGENYVRCCSQETGDGVYEGRLTEYLKSLHDLPFEHKYYLCGSAEMVVETRDLLIAKGIAFEQIIAEIYF